MIKLVVVKFFRQKSFKKTISTLTEEEAWLLGFQEKNNEIQIPTGSALHHFVKYRLGVEGIDKIMLMLGKKIAKLSNQIQMKQNWIQHLLKLPDILKIVNSIHTMNVKWIRLILQ